MYFIDDFEPADRWLLSQRNKPRKDVSTSLQVFTGIGPKVSDCIALSSLDQFETIPVDTHVRQLGEKYLPNIPKNVRKFKKIKWKKIMEIKNTLSG